jgi:hypothetical protein
MTRLALHENHRVATDDKRTRDHQQRDQRHSASRVGTGQ